MSEPLARAQARGILKDRLELLADLVQVLDGQVIVEDEWGQRFDILKTLVIDRQADDPGVMLRIRRAASQAGATNTGGWVDV